MQSRRFHTCLMGEDVAFDHTLVAERKFICMHYLYHFIGHTVQIVSPRPPISFGVGTNVTFKCEATRSRLALWVVNMTQLAGPITRGAFARRGIITDPRPMLQEIENISYTLYALASFENNRTVIKCKASMSVPPHPYISSDKVTLLVFGECFYHNVFLIPTTQFLQV